MQTPPTPILCCHVVPAWGNVLVGSNHVTSLLSFFWWSRSNPSHGSGYVRSISPEIESARLWSAGMTMSGSHVRILYGAGIAQRDQHMPRHNESYLEQVGGGRGERGRRSHVAVGDPLSAGENTSPNTAPSLSLCLSTLFLLPPPTWLADWTCTKDKDYSTSLQWGQVTMFSELPRGTQYCPPFVRSLL